MFSFSLYNLLFRAKKIHAVKNSKLIEDTQAVSMWKSGDKPVSFISSQCTVQRKSILYHHHKSFIFFYFQIFQSIEKKEKKMKAQDPFDFGNTTTMSLINLCSPF